MAATRHWFFSRPDVHQKAAWEVTFLTGTGLLALAFAPVLDFARRSFLNEEGAFLNMYAAISGGQLFPFAFSLVGALLWLHSREYKGKIIPLRSLLSLLIWVPSFAAVGIYSLSLDIEKHPAWSVSLSVVVVLFFCLMRYYLIVVRDMPVEDVQAGLQRQSDAMIARAKARREGQR